MEYGNIILCSASTLKANTPVNYNVDDNDVGIAIRTAQRLHLESIIGTRLLHRLQALVGRQMGNLADNINSTNNASYKTLLDDFVSPLLTFQAENVLLGQIAQKVRNMGVIKVSDNGVQPVSLGELNYRRNEVRTLIADASTRISKYLDAQRALFPEVTAKADAWEKPAMLGKTFANTSLSLGGKHNCGCL